MQKLQCGLCSHIYDEAVESVSWKNLADNWLCPVCGSPKSSFIPSKAIKSEPVERSSTAEEQFSNLYECGLCSFQWDELVEKMKWGDLPDTWTCPVCGSGKDSFIKKTRSTPEEITVPQAENLDGYLEEWHRSADEFESHMTDIHQISVSRQTIIDPMRTRNETVSWNDILFKGAQLFKLPLNKSRPVNTGTVIGPAAAVPLKLKTPILVSHMSFGALSREVKLAMAKGSAAAGAAMCSGEGGILPECLDAAYKYIFEYVPNKYSLTDEYLQRVDAVEIKIGQSAKPGMGGHLPGNKVTREIAEIRGFREGQDIISPSCFPDIHSKEDLRRTVADLRKRTSGKPIGVKLAACHIEEDMKIALYAKPDFITVDGRAGGTAAAPKLIKGAASIPTVFALARARKFLDEQKADDVSLIITGGLRVSSDIAKALGMGADAVALATSVMMAAGCQQYRICNTGRCPVGIATQDPALRARFNIETSAARVSNFFTVSTDELKDFARMSGNPDIHVLCPEDLTTGNSEISNYTNINHV